MFYEIFPAQIKIARKLGVKIAPSTRKNKKLDIYDWNGQYICSIGDIRYKDYNIYIQEKGKEYADNRRRLYHIRHKEREIGSPGFYSKEILW